MRHVTFVDAVGLRCRPELARRHHSTYPFHNHCASSQDCIHLVNKTPLAEEDYETWVKDQEKATQKCCSTIPPCQVGRSQQTICVSVITQSHIKEQTDLSHRVRAETESDN